MEKLVTSGVRDSGSAAAVETAVAVHAAPVPGGEWRLWRTAVLRGAGFPARLILPLAGDEEAAAADRYLAACDEVQRRRREVADAVTARLAAADPETRRRLKALGRKIWRGLPEEAGGVALDDVRTALAARDAAYRELVRVCDADAAVVSDRIRTLAADRRFREALVWQNRAGATHALRRVEERRGSAAEQRRAIEFVAMHAQRYAVKNDSVGFFGPVCWATLTDDDRTIDLRPGPDLVEHREVFFEGWCMDELVAHLDKDPAIRPWTSPRRRPEIWCGPDGVHVSGDSALALDPIEQQVLRLCDGVRTAADIASVLVDATPPVAEHERAVFDVLDRLVERKLLVWQLEIAPQLRPERELAWRLARIGDDAARDASLQALDALTAARDAVAGAAGDPEALAIRLRDLDATFTGITGLAPARRHGETYAARGLVYEDCRRACDVTIGRAFFERIGPALSPVLDAARWLAGDLAAAGRRYLRLRHAEMRAQAGDAVDAMPFVKYVFSGGPRALQALGAEVAQRYQERWQSVFQLQDGERRRWYDVAEFAARMQRAFGALEPTVARARYVSPDLMVAAESAEALRRGEFYGVLGEVHGTNSLLASPLLSQHPHPELVTAALACDTAEECFVVVQLARRDWLARANLLVLPTFWRYESVASLSSLPGCRALPAALLQAFDTGDTVMMRARDGSIEFDTLELFYSALARQLHVSLGQRLPDAPHTPRLVVGDLTVMRESWFVAVADLPFLEERDEYAQFAAVRRWARDRGMPRHVFYRSPAEPKPCFLDFDSRLYVHIFVKMMRHAAPGAHVRIVEMLPGVHETWLHDAAGERYTCELRMAGRHAVDDAGSPGRV
jgi:hypothetical protein